MLGKRRQEAGTAAHSRRMTTAGFGRLLKWACGPADLWREVRGKLGMKIMILEDLAWVIAIGIERRWAKGDNGGGNSGYSVNSD